MTIAAAGIVCASAAARAAPGYVVEGVNLRAGPGTDYPVVAQLPPGTPTEIFGCLPGWTWCDIAVNGPEGSARGWAAGVTLQVVYDNQPVPLPQYGPALGLPFVGFDIGPYWDRNYRGRPFYGDEDRWRGRGFGGGPGDGGPRPPFNGNFGRGPGEFQRGGPPEFRGPPGGPPGFPPGPPPGLPPGGHPGGFGGRGPVGNVGGPPPGRGPEFGPPGGGPRGPGPQPHGEPGRPEPGRPEPGRPPGGPHQEGRPFNN